MKPLHQRHPDPRLDAADGLPLTPRQNLGIGVLLAIALILLMTQIIGLAVTGRWLARQFF
jgi:hypothetical protein